MKKHVLIMIGICFLFFSCQTELLEVQEEGTLTSSSSSDKKKKKKGHDDDVKYRECIVIDADRSPYGARQQPANFWWSKNGGTDYFDRSTYFSSDADNNLVFTEYENGTANISGTTVNGGCVVTVDVWLKDEKSWDEWSTTEINGIPGAHKKEGTAGDASNSEDMRFYVIDSQRSIISAEGDCVATGTFAVEQRPDPYTDGMNYGAHIGPGGANYDSNIGAIGLSTWGYLTEINESTTTNCNDCDGKLNALTLQYNGGAAATIKVVQKKDGLVAFEGTVQPGDEFSFTGQDDKGTLGTEITVYVNGVENTRMHTSCSDPKVVPGYVGGDFLVTAGSSRNGGALCGSSIELGARLYVIDFNFRIECPEVECQPCEGKVTELELQYNGDEAANLIVKTKGKGKEEGSIVFEGLVNPGETFSFVGNDDKGTLGTEITIYANGSEDEKIHTSCSKPIGPGAIFGDYTVVTGASREGGELCPAETPPGEDCSECEGKVTELELQYNGDQDATIIVKTKEKKKKKKGHDNDEDINPIVFEGDVSAGGTFSFVGNDKKGTLGTEITIYVNGEVAQKIHTSCSVPIGPGAIFGDFTVISGASREGGELCTIE
ncbi:DUF7467 domain-containing protein [Changchengzhania lutea]|uniref:DUF7467 domain-containing protein n=1 Tax=Changchengzhania lutea TaxID=2049305 RepID=UPI00115C606A|nr:hypothetical protein [Changchengzhania lutea]